MKSSIQVQNEIRECDNRIDELSAKFNAAEGDVQAAIHDEICEVKGKKSALYDQLPDIQEYENSIRKSGGVPLAAGEPEKKFKPANAAQKFLGNPAEFKGFTEDMFKNGYKVAINDAYTDFGLGETEEMDYNLPAQSFETYNFGIMSTLPQGSTEADILEFFQRVPTAYQNKAGKWVKGQAKPQSAFQWQRASTHTEWIANTIPVLEPELKDYGQLEATINNELMFMNRLVLSDKVVNGEVDATNPGIVGLTQIDGHLTYSKKSSDTLADSLLKMKNDVFLATGFIATHVAVHPFVEESLLLEKDGENRYMNLMINGQLWALNVVDDINLVSGETGSEKYGAMVYYPAGATLFTKNSDAIALGLVNEQFTHNEKTIRCEGEYALKVTTPAAFSLLADTGVAGR